MTKYTFHVTQSNTTWFHEKYKMSTTSNLLLGGERTTGENIRSQNGMKTRVKARTVFNYMLIL